MNIFTVNQVNQVYVLTTSSDSPITLDKTHALTNSNGLGTVGIGKTTDGKNIYFKHKGAGGITRSDLIPIANIESITATPAAKMARPKAAALITINAEALSSSKPIAGEDYILRLKFQNPIGMSPDNQYWKWGAVHASDMSASAFYLKMASSIAKNMARDAVQLIKVYVTSSGADVEITAASDVSDTSTFSGTYTGVKIVEVEQEWIPGIKQEKPLIFSVEPSWITLPGTNGTNVVWGDVVYNTSKKYSGGTSPSFTTVQSGAPDAGTIVNSKLAADYEYFFMGERGDQYRMVGWPDYVPTKYLVDPTSAYGYDMIIIHYSYTGANHSVQKSEKDITFVVPRISTDTTATSLGAQGAALLEAIETAVYGEEEEGD